MDRSEEPFQGTERFSLVRKLGVGGMGVVYEVYDTERHVHVALKILSDFRPQALLYFKQEFRSLADLTHPNLAVLYELGSEGQQWYFTMELIDGVDFLDYVWCRESQPPGPAIPQGPSSAATVSSQSWSPAWAQPEPQPKEPHRPCPCNFERLRSCLRQLVEGVRALHVAGKLHCDIKPSNVLVTPQGSVKLLDFGLVIDLRQRDFSLASAERFHGTVLYASPEQAAGGTASESTDWYSVGVTLYQALTGQLPFNGSWQDVLLAKQDRDPPPPSGLAPGVPDDLNQMCMALLQRRPEDRLTGLELLRRLGETSLTAGSEFPAQPSRRSTLFVGRQSELTDLRSAFSSVEAGRTTVVYLHGTSGIGKTALMEHFLEELDSRSGAIVLRGRCYEREAVPYKAFDSLVDSLTHYLRFLPAPAVAALIPADVAVLAQVFPVLLRVACIASAPRQKLENLDQRDLRRRAFEALREMLARIAQRKRLTVCIDDLHWGDRDSAVLLSEILRPPAPVMLVICAYRSEDAGTSPCLQSLLQEPLDSGALDVREVEVGPLDAAAAERLMRHSLGSGGAYDPDVILRESGGNPYFIQELAQHASTQSGTPGEATLSQPTSLDAVIWGRVQRLPEDSRRLLEVLAVSGRPLSEADVYQAAQLKERNLTALALLLSARLARSTAPGGRGEVESYHDRIRETVLSRLEPHTLPDVHYRLAVTLESSGRGDEETLAFHFESAGQKARAGRSYELAAQKASESFAFEHAAELYRKALGLQELDLEAKQGLLERLADTLANAGRSAEAATTYQKAAAGRHDSEALELKRRAAYCLCTSGYVDLGKAAFRDLLQGVGVRLPATRRGAAVSLLLAEARLLWNGNRLWRREATAISSDELRRADVTWGAAVGLALVDNVYGANLTARSLLLAARTGEPRRLARSLIWEAATVACWGPAGRRRGKKLLGKCTSIVEELDDPYSRGLLTLANGLLEFNSGYWKSARKLLAEAEGIFREDCRGAIWELATTRTFELYTLIDLGELAELSVRSPALLEDALERGDLYMATNIGVFVEPNVRLAADRPAAARQIVRDSLSRWSKEGYHQQRAMAALMLGWVDLYTGEAHAAWQFIDKEWPVLKKNHFLRVEIIRQSLFDLRARCELAAAAVEEDPEPRLRSAEQYAGKLEQQELPWARAMAKSLRSSIAEIRGDRPSAVAHLKDACRQFGELDMGVFAATARRRLGELVGGDGGHALIVEADAWMEKQKIRNPAKLAAAFTSSVFQEPAALR